MHIRAVTPRAADPRSRLRISLRRKLAKGRFLVGDFISCHRNSSVILTAIFFAILAGQAEALALGSSRIQVGNLVFAIPPSVHVTSEWTDRRSEFRFHYPLEMRDPTARRVDGFTIYGKDVWAISGTHSTATKWEYGDIQMTVAAMSRDVRISLCEQWLKYKPDKTTPEVNGFYIFGGNNKARYGFILATNNVFFSATILLSTISGGGDVINYSLYQPITMNVSVQVRFSSVDIKDITIFKVLQNIHRNITVWISPASFSPSVLGFNNKKICDI